MDLLPFELCEEIALLLPLRDVYVFSLLGRNYHALTQGPIFRRRWAERHVPAALPPALRREAKGDFYRWHLDLRTSIAMVQDIAVGVVGSPAWSNIMDEHPYAFLAAACLTDNLDLADTIFWAYALFAPRWSDYISIYIEMLAQEKKFEDIHTIACIASIAGAWKIDAVPPLYRWLFRCPIREGDYTFEDQREVERGRPDISRFTSHEQAYLSGWYTREYCFPSRVRPCTQGAMKPSECRALAAVALSRGNLAEYRSMSAMLFAFARRT